MTVITNFYIMITTIFVLIIIIMLSIGKITDIKQHNDMAESIQEYQIRVIRAHNKIIDSINSCKTVDQLDYVNNLIDNYENLGYKYRIDYIYKKFRNKQIQLSHKSS